jgi:DNA-directed RNA polymerase specialized sigma24 family protein
MRMANFTKNKLQDAMSAVRAIFYDAIETRIRYSGQSYAAIAAELGCSEQTVYQLARLRNLRRTTHEASANEEQTTSASAVNSGDAGGGNE